MGLFGKLKGKGIDEFAAEAKEQGIRIIDVREPDEFAHGHIPGAVNVPLGSLESITDVAPDKAEMLYVHCLGGVRSSRACMQLKSMGYAKTVNIGGIRSYHGPIER